jgi:hypothetical protein
MYWIDVAMILFSCVAANHLGLIHAIETAVKRELPIINCPRCFSFWSVLFYTLLTSHMIILSFATSFLTAALAPWIELFMGFTDSLYNKIYDTIFSTTED